MTVPIADLECHPSLTAWMESRFGTCCNNMVVLMMIAVVGCADKHDLDVEAHHIALVRKIVGIAKASRRPQRIPTFDEFAVLLRDYKGMLLIREVRWTGGTLVPAQAEKKIIEAMTSHDQAAAVACIGSAA